MTKQTISVYVMCLICALALMGAATGITPDQKSSPSPGKTPALAAGNLSKSQAPTPKAEHSARKVTVASARAQKTKRRSKQVIIVIVVDDQESSWI
jgi:hypothetical protein